LIPEELLSPERQRAGVFPKAAKPPLTGSYRCGGNSVTIEVWRMIRRRL